MKLYRELAPWWHTFSAPEDYADEAADAWTLLQAAVQGPLDTLLELGAGGGNNASFLKAHAQLTLTDLSTEMLEQSQRLNPTCEHLQGDMRTLRLGRTFDAVLLHDAIMYMHSEDDLAAAIRTAWLHCRPGGAALFMPDCTAETIEESTSSGGHDADDGRSVRYLEWSGVPRPGETTARVDFALLLREPDGTTRVEHDTHTFGVFARQRWVELLNAQGFRCNLVNDRYERDLFIATRPSA